MKSFCRVIILYKGKAMNKMYILCLLVCASIFTGCSPVDKVKWGSVDLFGNEIKVRKITTAVAGSTGTVIWTYGENLNSNGMDIIIATIKKGDDESMLHFEYNSISRECRLINFEKNGEAVSPFMIYKHLGKNR